MFIRLSYDTFTSLFYFCLIPAAAVMRNPSLLVFNAADDWTPCFSVSGEITMNAKYLVRCISPVTGTLAVLELSQAQVYGATPESNFHLSFYEVEIYGTCLSAAYSTAVLIKTP